MSLLRSFMAHLHEVEGFGVSAVCAAISMPRSSYYFTRTVDVPGVSPGCGVFGKQIGEIFREHHRQYGSRRISQELARRGVQYGGAIGRTERITERNAMCLAIPGQVIDVEGDDPLLRTARVRFGGITKSVNLAYTPDVKPGEYVLVHVGFALSIIDEKEAKRVFEYLDEIGEVSEVT